MKCMWKFLNRQKISRKTGSKKGIEPAQIQSNEYYDFIVSKPPNLSKLETLAIYTTEGGVPEYYKQKNICQEKTPNPTFQDAKLGVNSIID